MLTRRSLFGGVSASALLINLPALARFPRGSSSTTFTGNPNVTITAINTAGGIVSSRDSDGSTYQTPFFIQVSASAITATGTSAPYEDLSYSWDFGDPTGTETFTRPTDGATVNANTQNGPEATYVYRTAGPKTITLTIYGCNGTVNSAGLCLSPVVATITKNITVNAFGGTDAYADSNGVASGQDGTSAHPWTTLAQVNTAISGGNVALHIKRGSHFTGQNGILVQPSTNKSNFRFDAYGSGADPIVELSVAGGSFPAFAFFSSATVNDVVVSNLSFLNTANTGSGSAAAAGFLNQTASAIYKNCYFDNCTFNVQIDVSTVVFGAPTLPTTGTAADLNYSGYNFAWWKCSFINPTTSALIDSGLSGSAQYWNAIVGCYFIGAGVNSASHHIYPDVKDHAHVKWNNFGDGGIGTAHQRGYCYNGNMDGIYLDPTSNIVCQYHSISENYFYGCLLGFDLGNRSNNTNASDSTVQYQYVVAENNFWNGIGGEGFDCGLSVTLRDNRARGLPASDCRWYGPSAQAGQRAAVAQKTHLTSRVYRNKVYVETTVTSGAVISYPDAGWTAKQQISYNVIVDARAVGAQAVRLISTDQAAATSVVNNNTYYSAGGYTTFLTDNITNLTFAQWQTLGWDMNGSSLGSNTLGWTLPVTQWSHMN